MTTLFEPIEVYTQPNCKPCDDVKLKLEAAGIEFEVIDITTDAQALAYVTQVLGAKSTPIIVTATHEPVIGDRPKELADLIEFYTASETGV